MLMNHQVGYVFREFVLFQVSRNGSVPPYCTLKTHIVVPSIEGSQLFWVENYLSVVHYDHH